MIEYTGSAESPLARLEKQENELWHAMEREIQSHAMKMAKREAVSGVMPLIDAVEEFRESARVIADGIRQQTSIIRQELLIIYPTIGVEALAAEVDKTLQERIDFHFKPHELPNTPK